MSVIPSLFYVCVHLVLMCPDKDTEESHIDAVTMSDWFSPNKEKLHVPGITRIPFIVVLHNVLWFLFVRENKREPQPNNKLNITLAAKQLNNTDSRSGKWFIALRWRTCGQVFVTWTDSASAPSGPGYNDVTHQSLCVCCGCKFVPTFSRPKSCFSQNDLLNH